MEILETEGELLLISWLRTLSYMHPVTPPIGNRLISNKRN